MNETPLHEPLIAEEGKEKERVFTGTPERIVNICLASISALIIYWTVYVSADVMWKHGLYIMTVFCMTLVIYPFGKKAEVNHVSLVDWLLIIGSIAGSAYAIWEYLDRFMRLGMLTEMDIFFGCLMLFLGLEVGRRVIGWSLTLVSIVLILYSLYGFVIPGHFGHGGFDLEAVVTQVYAGMEGYYGLSAKMMIQYVAPFILMGAFLEKSGAGDFFIRLAFALTRNTVGGPAKAAVIGSALLGSISGSAVANVSSTGVLTIPMMKKVGYRPHVAGAIEAAASTGGQIMPPIMGATAFVMADVTGAGYLAVAKAALLPSLLYYFSLLMMIHFEAVNKNIGIIPSDQIPDPRSVLRRTYHILPIIVLIGLLVSGRASFPPRSSPSRRSSSSPVSARKPGSRRRAFTTRWNSPRAIALMISTCSACAGIIVAIVSITGIGYKFINLITILAGDSLFLLMVYLMLTSFVLGMGIPTTPAYIVVATLGAPALIKAGAPQLVAHMFVFYYAILSFITPPVCVAAFAGAAIAESKAMETGFIALKLGIVAFIVPYIFAFNNTMLFIGDFGPLDVVQVVLTSSVGMFLIAAGMIGYMLRDLNWGVRIVCIAAGLMLIHPGTLTDIIGIGVLVVVLVFQIITGKGSKAVKAA